jgi:hypothetical protein
VGLVLHFVVGFWGRGRVGLVVYGSCGVSPVGIISPLHRNRICICSKVGSHGRVYDRLLKPFSFFYRLQFFYLLLQAFVKFHFSAALVRKVHTSL